jgi:hypothetical protein
VPHSRPETKRDPRARGGDRDGVLRSRVEEPVRVVQEDELTENHSMTKRLVPALMIIALLTIAAPGALAKPRWPSRATPLDSTLGWFEAINSHDRRQALSYVAPSARGLMGWARPSATWPKFTDLHCRTRKRSGRSSADLRCTFHESASPVVGNLDRFWDIYLRHTGGGWLIYSYGQG